MGKEEISHCEAMSTPASGDQMEVVGYAYSFHGKRWHIAEDEQSAIDATENGAIKGVIVSSVTLDAAQKALTAANERAERAEAKNAQNKFDSECWEEQKHAIEQELVAAEALNTTLSEALVEIECHAAARPAIRDIATAALAAAKQGAMIIKYRNA